MTTGNGLAVAAAFVGGAYVLVGGSEEAGAILAICGVLGWIFSNVNDKL